MNFEFEDHFPMPEHADNMAAWERARAIHAELVELVTSGRLFSGIGVSGVNMKRPAGFPVITDVVEAGDMLYMDDDRGEFMELMQTPLDYNVRDSYQLPFLAIRPRYNMDSLSGKFALKMGESILHVMREHQVEEELNRRAGNEYAEEATIMIVDPAMILFRVMIDAAWYGGVDKHPLAKRLMEAYQTGGVPVGWVGPRFYDGGDPRECVQLLHFGRAEDSQVDKDPLP